MSGVTYWLQRQRKSELASLAERAGLKDYEGLLKSDLEVALEEHLRANESLLAGDSAFEPFYRRIGALSPVKRESGGGGGGGGGGGAGAGLTSGDEVKKQQPRARRQTRVRGEVEGLSDSDSVNRPSRTPRTTALVPLSPSIPLPPSPSVLADRIESQANTIRASVSNYIATSPLPSTLATIRTTLSSVISIELLALFIEAWGLRAQVLPLRYLTTIPAMPALGTGDIPIKIPDLFAALTLGFWGPVALWVLTSIALPLLAAWFVNLTEGAKIYDPLSFNVAKALLAWIVYVKGGISGQSREVVQRGVPGGAQGLLVAAGIGALASLYEAVLRK